VTIDIEIFIEPIPLEEYDSQEYLRAGHCYVEGCGEPLRYWVGYAWGEDGRPECRSGVGSCKFHVDEYSERIRKRKVR